MMYVWLVLLMLLFMFLGYALNDRWTQRAAREMSEEIERYIEAELEIRLKEARTAEGDSEPQCQTKTG